MQYCHSRGVLHKDIKMENVIVGSDLSVRLIDFGYSEVVSEQSNPTTRFCGTPYYFPPEFILKRAAAGSLASDLWSLGVLFYRVMYGVFPFAPESGDKRDLWKLILNGTFAYPQDSKPCDALFINSFLFLDPAKRVSLDIAVNYLKCLV